ncbi:MAG: hypothetical protein QM599_03620 [Pseudoxanthomonas sp.]
MRSKFLALASPTLAFGLLFAGHACAVESVDTRNNRILGLDDARIEHNGETHIASNLGTLVVVGRDAYATKTNTSNGPGWTAFYKIADFLGPNPVVTTHTVRVQGEEAPADMGHGNGLAYANGAFYLAMIHEVDDYQIAQLDENGQVIRQFKAQQGGTGKKAASITPYRDGKFIIGTADENVEKGAGKDLVVLKPYYVASIEGDVFQLGEKFYVPTTGDYNVGQATHYSPEVDEFLVPVWDGNGVTGAATGRGNRIIVVKLGEVKDGATYEPARLLNCKAAESEAKKFEIEGIAQTTDGEVYVSANVTDTEGKATDGIYKVERKN